MRKSDIITSDIITSDIITSDIRHPTSSRPTSPDSIGKIPCSLFNICHLRPMKLAVVIFYLAIMFIYILFSRQPDWFDGEITYATVVKHNDTLLAEYTINRQKHFAPVQYLFRNIRQAQTVKVIYEASQPEYAAVYSWWGYWIRWQEILISILLYAALIKIATSVTNNPTPESLIEQLEGKDSTRKRRYED